MSKTTTIHAPNGMAKPNPARTVNTGREGTMARQCKGRYSFGREAAPLRKGEDWRVQVVCRGLAAGSTGWRTAVTPGYTSVRRNRPWRYTRSAQSCVADGGCQNDPRLPPEEPIASEQIHGFFPLLPRPPGESRCSIGSELHHASRVGFGCGIMGQGR